MVKERPADGRKLWKTFVVCAAHVPEKVKVFAWKVANNGIPIVLPSRVCYFPNTLYGFSSTHSTEKLAV